MRYGFMGMAMPLIMDKAVYAFLRDYGIDVTPAFKKKIRKEYKEIVARTPALGNGNSLTKILYIGCYMISFHKAFPDVIDEKCFEGLVRYLCDEMLRRQKEDESAFSEKNIRTREEAARKSQTSSYEMDWKSTFRRIDKDNYEFTYTKCGLCELGRREDCFQLIKYLCMTDFISFDKGGAKLVRNHTLANGDDYCDFHVSRKN
jgi:type I restriction enzyme S subunit